LKKWDHDKNAHVVFSHNEEHVFNLSGVWILKITLNKSVEDMGCFQITSAC